MDILKIGSFNTKDNYINSNNKKRCDIKLSSVGKSLKNICKLYRFGILLHLIALQFGAGRGCYKLTA